MAHANLQVSKSLQTAFEKAQSSEPMRWLMAKVSDVTFDLFKAGKSSGDLGRDLESLKQALDADACIIIVCVDETSSPKKWTLVAYVPSTEKVKRRMLFASGRNDIKRFLGQEYFKGEAHVEDKADLTVEAVMRDKTELEDLPYTMEELAIKEDHAQSSRPSGKTEKGMANVEFPLTPALEAALLEFRQGTVDWIEVEVTKEEQVGVVQKASIRSLTASVQPRIDSKNPRFYLACRCGTAMGDRTYLVFCWCVCAPGRVVCFVRTHARAPAPHLARKCPRFVCAWCTPRARPRFWSRRA
jgi:hypothetical protein